MQHDLTWKLRDLGDSLAADYEYRRSTLAYQAAHHIEHLEQKVKALEEMLEDAEGRQNTWYERYVEAINARKPPNTVVKANDFGWPVYAPDGTA